MYTSILSPSPSPLPPPPTHPPRINLAYKSLYISPSKKTLQANKGTTFHKETQSYSFYGMILHVRCKRYNLIWEHYTSNLNTYEVVIQEHI